MNKNQVLVYLLFGGLGAVVIGSVVYNILRWLKGSVRLEFANRAYRPGETIQGAVHLKCRQPVDAQRFFVALLCYEVTPGQGGQKSSTQRREVLRQEVDVAPPGQFAAGTERRFEFAVPISDPQEPIISTGNQTIDSVVRTISSFSGLRRLEWSLEARVDARGVDLAQRQRVSVNAI